MLPDRSRYTTIDEASSLVLIGSAVRYVINVSLFLFILFFGEPDLLDSIIFALASLGNP